MWKMQASYAPSRGARKSSTSGFGVERSMWQRHTQRGRVVWTNSGIADRLGVVHDDDVPLVGVGERVGVQLVVAVEDRALAVGQRPLVALERVVDRLRDVVELLLALDDAPLGVDPRVDHERDQRVLDLGHAAPERGRREVQHPPALERLRQGSDLLRERSADQRVVIGQRLVSDVDALHRPRRLANHGRCRRTGSADGLGGEHEREPREAVLGVDDDRPAHALGQLVGDGEAEPAAGRGRLRARARTARTGGRGRAGRCPGRRPRP